MDKVLDFLSDYCVSLNYQKLSEGVVHHAKKRIIDTLGCAMGSYYMGPSKIARAHALEVVSTPGSTVLGTRHRSAPEQTAFANGAMARYLDFNDLSASGKGGHTSDNITAVLSAADYAGADMQTTITSVVLAYEIQDRIATACADVTNMGWDRQIVYVALASTAGAGKAMGLNKEQMANALALAAVPNLVTRQTRVGELSNWKGCAAANAARNGVFAAMIARRGLTGPQEAFEGSAGFKVMFGTSMKLPTFGGNGVPFTIESSRFKYFPFDYEVQCAIHPAIEFHKILKGKVDEIEKIDIETYDSAVMASADGPAKWNPTNKETADHSLPYGIAVALTRGNVWLDDFDEERIRDPKIHALMQKIHVQATDELNKLWPEAYPFRITVTTKSGQKHFQEILYAKGHPKNPMTDQDIEAKFRRLAEPTMGRAQVDNALKKLWHLQDMKSVREVLDLFVLDSTRPDR